MSSVNFSPQITQLFIDLGTDHELFRLCKHIQMYGKESKITQTDLYHNT